MEASGDPVIRIEVEIYLRNSRPIVDIQMLPQYHLRFPISGVRVRLLVIDREGGWRVRIEARKNPNSHGILRSFRAGPVGR